MVVGNTAVGVMTTVTAMNFAMQGRITGGGPSFQSESDKANSGMLHQIGHPTLSIWVPLKIHNGLN